MASSASTCAAGFEEHQLEKPGAAARRRQSVVNGFSIIYVFLWHLLHNSGVLSVHLSFRSCGYELGPAKGRAECRVLYEDTTKKASCKSEAGGESFLGDSLYGAVWCSTVVYVILWHVLQFIVTLQFILRVLLAVLP